MHAIEQHTASFPFAEDFFDEDGFVRDPSAWTPELAERLGELEGIRGLTDKHRVVIDHVREKFLKLGALPAMRLVCKATGIPKEEIHELFGSCRAIWRVSGLPNPGEEAKAYFS